MDLGLKSKTAVITGASIGIGRAIARGRAAEGVRVVGVARRADLLAELVKEIATRQVHSLSRLRERAGECFRNGIAPRGESPDPRRSLSSGAPSAQAGGVTSPASAFAKASADKSGRGCTEPVAIDST
ncbi:NAD(P)-dependent dehydrogenase (short-subunit alcohol dehydrogenase family) [Bradyrhizobium yuanmingense]|uniref:SDR family NAD(P)-dependent oxidoreductase n=1 Tax=Bradyrhizobium yuanmingense TaxID=108015 RepID=UPI0035172D46